MMVPIAEFAPDQPPIETGTSGYVDCVTPRTKASYGPLPALVAVGNALTARCQGAISFRGASGGSVVNFAGDATKLYKWDGTAWQDVSRLVGGAYATAIDDFWQFTQFGDLAIAVNGTDAPQQFTIDLSANFSVLLGSPPVGRFVASVLEFIVLGRLSTGKNRIQWSGIGAPNFWTIGQQLCDEAIFADGGQVMGIIGGQGMLVFQETAIRLGTFVGPGKIFDFKPISIDRGCAAANSIAAWKDLVFFLSFDGFYMLSPDGIRPIGNQKLDNAFWHGAVGLPAVNPAFIYRVVASVDPDRTRYIVAYPSVNSALGTPDVVLFYDWTIDRWTRATLNLDFLYRARTSLGYTLEQLDVPWPNMDTMPISWDSALLAGSPQEILGAFGTDFKSAFFQGPPMAATMDTIKAQIIPGEKAKIVDLRPNIDGGLPAEITVAIGMTDNKLNDTERWTADVAQNDRGTCKFAGLKTKARFHKARVKVAAGANWTHMEGVDPTATGMGNR